MGHIGRLAFHKFKTKMSKKLFISKRRNWTKSSLGYFLAGLIDADGYLRRGELAITLNRMDSSFCLMLQSLFGGRCRYYKQCFALNYELNKGS